MCCKRTNPTGIDTRYLEPSGPFNKATPKDISGKICRYTLPQAILRHKLIRDNLTRSYPYTLRASSKYNRSTRRILVSKTTGTRKCRHIDPRQVYRRPNNIRNYQIGRRQKSLRSQQLSIIETTLQTTTTANT